jgi:L,D-peptidoglycan transpeptidase YkuD (ErfK/YbiS/YcfS/YnhG family)
MGATPRGILRIAALMYRPDRVAPPAPWALPIYLGDLWCDDPAHKSYNQLCRAPLKASHEQMRRADPQYDIVLITDWNWPKARPGAGSAIFMHQWRRPGSTYSGLYRDGAARYPLAGQPGRARHAAYRALI